MRQRVDSLQSLSVEAAGRDLATSPHEIVARAAAGELTGLGAVLHEREHLQETFDEAFHEAQDQARGVSINHYEQIAYEKNQASAEVDNWLRRIQDDRLPWGLYKQEAPLGVALLRPGELDYRWLMMQLGREDSIAIWISQWESAMELILDDMDEDELTLDGYPLFVPGWTFKRVEGELRVREEDEVIPGREVQIGGGTVTSPERRYRADFVRFLRGRWPERADSVLDYLKRKLAEREAYGERTVAWHIAGDRPCTLPEKLRLLRKLVG